SAERVDNEKQNDLLVRGAFAAEKIIHYDRGDNHLRRGRNREPDEMALFDVLHLHVEAREPQRSADCVETRGEPAPGAPRYERPVIHENRRREAERYEVRERVELDAELARGLGDARDEAVEAVENIGENDEESGLKIFSVEGGDQREETADEIARRKEARNNVNAALELRFPLVHTLLKRHARLRPSRQKPDLRPREPVFLRAEVMWVVAVAHML